MNDLAKILMVSPPAATGLIDRLIGQKLVLRENDEQDRRIIWISLTAKGKTVVRSIRNQKIQTLTRVFSRISAIDREHYLDILRKIVKISDNEPVGKVGK
jgi:DNA-binding MarR family transcriptional regulator